MQVKERKPSDLIIEISRIAGRLDKLTDDQLGEFGRLKDVAGELLTSVANAENKLRAAKRDLKTLLEQICNRTGSTHWSATFVASVYPSVDFGRLQRMLCRTASQP